jgi:hypothetical protein
MLTPAELAQRSTRDFGRVSADTAFRSATIALKTLGYEITSADAASGTIKTAPREIMTSTSAVGGDYTAVASTTRDELAWTLQVSPNGDGARIVATPRPFSGGNEVPVSMLPAAAIDPKFAALWKEIRASLGVPPGA